MDNDNWLSDSVNESIMNYLDDYYSLNREVKDDKDNSDRETDNSQCSHFSLHLREPELHEEGSNGLLQKRA
jgi:hypothetical protein